MLQDKEKNDETPSTEKELLMPTSQECGQRSQSDNTDVVQDTPGRNNVNLEGTVPLRNTPWRNRTIPRTISRENPLNETRADEPLGFGVTTDGIIRLCLHDNIRVDMTLDRAIRVMNYNSNIAVAVSASGSTAALLHPNGNVYQYGSRVEILAYDNNGNNKYAKMWYKGVSFTSDQCAVVYLVDSAGTRTTTDKFFDLSKDFSQHVFLNESLHGSSHVEDAKALLQQSNYWVTKEGTDNWIINQVRVSQTVDGLVRIDRNRGQYNLRTSPSNGSAGISTPFVHCTGSSGEAGHLFVRRGERRMHYSGNTFIVRNAGHSAGFDENQLKVF